MLAGKPVHRAVHRLRDNQVRVAGGEDDSRGDKGSRGGNGDAYLTAVELARAVGHERLARALEKRLS